MMTVREQCVKCGRRLWYRQVGSRDYAGKVPVFGWCARRGSTPPPLYCPVGGYHQPDGR